MKKRVGIYLRVSTDGQTTENQRRELQAVAGHSGWEIVGLYEDAGISGAKGRDKRPGFDRLLKDATARGINMIAGWSVDRLGRSLQDLVSFLSDFRRLAVISTSISRPLIPARRQAARCFRCAVFLPSSSGA